MFNEVCEEEFDEYIELFTELRVNTTLAKIIFRNPLTMQVVAETDRLEERFFIREDLTPAPTTAQKD